MNATDVILARFEELSAIPRGTKNEAGIRQWLIDWAGARGLRSATDEAGNLVIDLPASKGREESPTLILQGHLDMVCQKTPDSDHDFTRDPIRTIRDGDWLKADRTTLGADNGIAIAIGMALAQDARLIHPRLELLYTVEEEFGVGGAENLDPALLSGKTLINLDSEEDGVFTVGCAGGGSTYITLPVCWTRLSNEESAFGLKVGGLRGGHSGEDINKHRGNANKILARTLDEIQRKFQIRLGGLKGGTARNAIPREAEAVLVCLKGAATSLPEVITSFERLVQVEFADTEQKLFIRLDEKEQAIEVAIGYNDSRRGIQLILALPNGVAEMSAVIEGFVETSNNIGEVNLLEDGLHITSNQRSSVLSRLEEMTRRSEALSALAGAQASRTKLNPPWQADMNSPILKGCVEVYESLHRHKPRVELSHGGLECGILSKRCNGLDTISLGPTIENPHSPDEMLYIPSLSRTWDFLAALLSSL